MARGWLLAKAGMLVHVLHPCEYPGFFSRPLKTRGLMPDWIGWTLIIIIAAIFCIGLAIFLGSSNKR